MRTLVGVVKTLQCKECNLVFSKYLSVEGKLKAPCPSCGVLVQYEPSYSNKTHYVLDKGKYKDKSRLDGGVPFGEVPGDNDYNWMKEGKDWGPLP